MKTLKKLISALLIISLLLLAGIGSFAAEPQSVSISQDTTPDLRIKPLQDKLLSLTQTDLDAQAKKFKDIPTHWGKDYVSKLSALSIISGYTDGSFGVDDPLLGGHFTLIIMKTLGYTFEVPEGQQFYKPYVDQALKDKILFTGEITDYNKPLPREIAVAMARRALGQIEQFYFDYSIPENDFDVEGKYETSKNIFTWYQKQKMTDWSQINTKYLQPVIESYRIGIITGNDKNQFLPKSSLTRAEASVITVKLLDKKIRVESIPDKEAVKYQAWLATFDEGVNPALLTNTKYLRGSDSLYESHIAIMKQMEEGYWNGAMKGTTATNGLELANIFVENAREAVMSYYNMDYRKLDDLKNIWKSIMSYNYNYAHAGEELKNAKDNTIVMEGYFYTGLGLLTYNEEVQPTVRGTVKYRYLSPSKVPAGKKLNTWYEDDIRIKFYSEDDGLKVKSWSEVSETREIK